MKPVTTGEENKTWSKWTPNGTLELHITNPACVEAFKPGQVYRVTIEPFDGE